MTPRSDAATSAPEPALRDRLVLSLFVALLALAAQNREVFERVLPDGLLVEVVGDVPHPGLHLVGEPTVGAAVAVAGGESPDRRAVVGGTRLRVRDGVSVAPASDPLLLGHVIDVNVQGGDVLDDLPDVGPATAGAILDHRVRHGPFRSVEELGWVRGIGPVTLAEIAPLVGVGDVPPRDPPAPLDLNAATVAELEHLSGIGPTRAAAIVADREANGPFPDVASLDRVHGIGPGTVAGLGDAVTAR